MTEFLKKKFSSRAATDAYREGYEAIFGPKPEPETSPVDSGTRPPDCVCDVTLLPGGVACDACIRKYDEETEALPKGEVVYEATETTPGLSMPPTDPIPNSGEQPDGTYRMPCRTIDGSGYVSFRCTAVRTVSRSRAVRSTVVRTVLRTRVVNGVEGKTEILSLYEAALNGEGPFRAWLAKHTHDGVGEL